MYLFLDHVCKYYGQIYILAFFGVCVCSVSSSPPRSGISEWGSHLKTFPHAFYCLIGFLNINGKQELRLLKAFLHDRFEARSWFSIRHAHRNAAGTVLKLHCDPWIMSKQSKWPLTPILRLLVCKMHILFSPSQNNWPVDNDVMICVPHRRLEGACSWAPPLLLSLHHLWMTTCTRVSLLGINRLNVAMELTASQKSGSSAQLAY